MFIFLCFSFNASSFFLRRSSIFCSLFCKYSTHSFLWSSLICELFPQNLHWTTPVQTFKCSICAPYENSFYMKIILLEFKSTYVARTVWACDVHLVEAVEEEFGAGNELFFGSRAITKWTGEISARFLKTFAAKDLATARCFHWLSEKVKADRTFEVVFNHCNRFWNGYPARRCDTTFFHNCFSFKKYRNEKITFIGRLYEIWFICMRFGLITNYLWIQRKISKSKDRTGQIIDGIYWFKFLQTKQKAFSFYLILFIQTEFNSQAD